MDSANSPGSWKAEAKSERCISRLDGDPPLEEGGGGRRVAVGRMLRALEKSVVRLLNPFGAFQECTHTAFFWGGGEGWYFLPSSWAAFWAH